MSVYGSAAQQVLECDKCGRTFVRTLPPGSLSVAMCTCFGVGRVITHGCVLLEVEDAPVRGDETCGQFGRWEIDDGGCRGCDEEAPCFGEWVLGCYSIEEER